jgi:ornithine carbamoyltransferase
MNENRLVMARDLLERRVGRRRGHPEASFLAISELTKGEFLDLLRGGIEMKTQPQKYVNVLQGASVALLFQKTSTRTRCSFETGTAELGGHALYIDWETSNFTLANLEDEIRVLSRYTDIIMARVHKHADLLLMKEHSEVPIINGLSDLYHPCQGLADFMTLQEYYGSLEGLHLCYIGDGNNVCHSLIDGVAKAGMVMTIASPPGYGPNPEIAEAARREGAKRSTTRIP